MVTTKRAISLALISFSICILGCTKQPEIQYIEKPIYVEVPVATKIEIEPIKKPDYNLLKSIKPTSTPREIAEAYINTIKRMDSYIKQLEAVITSFYKKETDNAEYR